MRHLVFVTILAGCLMLLSYPLATAQTVSKILLSPIQPASLDYGEQVTVNFAYENNSGKTVWIGAVATCNGRIPFSLETEDPQSYPDGSSGSSSTWFTINSGAFQINQVRIYVVDKEQNVLYETTVSCHYYWPETSIFDFEFDPTYGYYESGTQVDIDFNYFTSETGGIRVFVQPRLDGVPDGNAVTAPAALLPEGGGSGSSWFSISVDEAHINGLYFWVTNDDQTDTLFEKTMNVDYVFIPNFYKSVFVDPQPCSLNVGEWVQVRFAYTCFWEDGALFALDCLEEGLPSDKDTVIGGFTVDQGIGYDTLWFTYNEPGHVQVLRMRMFDSDSVEMACGFNINVSYDFVAPTNNEVTSITLMTPSPATIDWDDQVSVAFNYTASDPSGVKVLVMPWLEGNISPHTVYSGTPVYPAGSGSGSQWFRATDCDTRVDEVHLRVMSIDNNVIYQDTGIAVDYEFANAHFTITDQTPASPATVEMGDEVMVHFDYETMCNSSFRTWVTPMTGGAISPGAVINAAPYAFAPDGSDSVGFSVDNAAEVIVDQLRFQTRSLDSTELYDELFFPVEYLFTEPTDVDIARQEGLPTQFGLTQNYPNPFNPSTTIEYDVARRAEIHVGVYNILGKLIRTLVSQAQTQGRYRVDWDGADESGRAVSSGVYFYRIEAGDYTETRKMMLLK